MTKSRYQSVAGLTAALICALPLALLAACGEPVVGTVVDRTHRNSWVEIYSEPTYGTRCTGTGTTRTCSSTVIGYHPASRYHAEEWHLIVKDAKGKNHTVGVRESTWDNKPLGSHFSETK